MNIYRNIYPNVILEDDITIGLFVIIGEPSRGNLPGELPTKIGKNAVIRSHTVIYAGNVIGYDFQTGHNVLIREENNIGNNVSIGSHSIIEHHVKIGDNVRIHSNTFIPEYSIIDDGAWIGPCVVFTNARYPRSKTVKENLSGPHVQSNAKIGAGAVLLPGIIIGQGALIGAGSVVVSNVPDGVLVVGNPARMIKYTRDIEAYMTD